MNILGNIVVKLFPEWLFQHNLFLLQNSEHLKCGEYDLTSVKDRWCDNGGTCENDKSCSCPSGYTGEHCGRIISLKTSVHQLLS